MFFRYNFVFLVLFATACAEGSAAGKVDASIGDAAASDAGRVDSGARDASIPCRSQFAVVASNPPECPCPPPNDSTHTCSVESTIVCRYHGDCRQGTSIVGVTATVQCIDGTWNKQVPDFCFAHDNDAGEDDAG